MQVWYKGHGKIWLDLPLLIDSAFAAGAAMITFGAVLGKVSPSQLMYLLILEVGDAPCSSALLHRSPLHRQMSGCHHFWVHPSVMAELYMSKTMSWLARTNTIGAGVGRHLPLCPHILTMVYAILVATGFHGYQHRECWFCEYIYFA